MMEVNGGERAETVHQVVTPQLRPDEQGCIDIDIQFRLPRSAEEFVVRVPTVSDGAQVRGFTRLEADVFCWDGEIITPEISLTVPDNGPDGHSADGTFVADGGQWAVIELPALAFDPTGAHDINRTVRVDGSGATSTDGNLVYLGPYRVFERRAARQRFRLIVPDAARLSATPEAILDTLTEASTRLCVGARYPTVFALALPDSHDWFGDLGRYSHGASFWVRADEPLSTPNTTWIHEYVHTRQSFTPALSARWLLDALADYYTGLLATQLGHVDPPRFRRFLTTGLGRPGVLTDPDSWPSTTTCYVQGRRVLAGLDARLRRCTDDGQSLQDVLWTLNRYPGQVDHTAVERVVSSLGDDDCADWLTEHVTKRVVPDIEGDIDQVLEQE
jgi:hypothetical protein